ncbi:hypothetical protein CEUSTIGMA_g10778.t1 [Chlamydomonas eustigma]|uniref:SGNH hydrolase-type esterase domain-containing protein n=1 Tax=Chlamydomonas eustigma TaxID=1157962 RepID=A0A250XJZ2_9CHLO|nr:hypothetical protein CEUSTIGMA_g10778.t1 [Chlamydomonas eustigma]|eukprot:GAX83353.1 hypothetical protein CEUSTIGMA_g10778.t1 [Chlamydomonas eustigma]
MEIYDEAGRFNVRGSLLWERIKCVRGAAGTAFLGSNHRLRAALSRGLSGKPLKIGVVRGSISHGHGSSRIGETDWASLLQKWASKSLQNCTLRNGSVPGTPSAYMAMCLDMAIDQDVDIVIAEYVVNDGKDNSIDNNLRLMEFERLTCSHGVTYPRNDSDWHPFHNGLEDVYGALAPYYDLPWLSFRAATFRRAAFLEDPEFTYKDIMNSKVAHDYLHPSDFGHQILADLVIWLFRQTALDLILRPWSSDDEELLQERMPTM